MAVWLTFRYGLGKSSRVVPVPSEMKADDLRVNLCTDSWFARRVCCICAIRRVDLKSKITCPKASRPCWWFLSLTNLYFITLIVNYIRIPWEPNRKNTDHNSSNSDGISHAWFNVVGWSSNGTDEDRQAIQKMRRATVEFFSPKRSNLRAHEASLSFILIWLRLSHLHVHGDWSVELLSWWRCCFYFYAREFIHAWRFFIHCDIQNDPVAKSGCKREKKE